MMENMNIKRILHKTQNMLHGAQWAGQKLSRKWNQGNPGMRGNNSI